jgi:hypothetical protein
LKYSSDFELLKAVTVVYKSKVKTSSKKQWGLEVIRKELCRKFFVLPVSGLGLDGKRILTAGCELTTGQKVALDFMDEFTQTLPQYYRQCSTRTIRKT